MRGIMVVIRRVDQNPKNRDIICRYCKKKDISNLNATSCRISIRKLLLIRRENNQKISVKPMLQKIITVMANS